MLLVFGSNNFAQTNASKLYIDVYGNHIPKVKLDNVLQNESLVYTVSKGTHRLELWCPGYEIIDTTVNVDSDSTVYNAQFKRPQDYASNKRLLTNSLVNALGGVTLFSTATFLLFNTGENRLDYIKSGHKAALNSNYEDDLAEAKRKLNRQYIASGVIYLGSAALFYNAIKIYKKKRANEKEYLENEQKFSIDNVGFNYNPLFMSGELCLTLNIF